MPEKTEILNLRRGDFVSIAQDVLGRGKILRFKANGRSMSPFIQNGDVVLYCSSYGSPVIHRVIQRGKESIITKGDSIPNSDQPMLSKQVLGRVAAVEKNGWRIRLDTPTGAFLNIFLATNSPFSFLIYPSLRFMKPVGFLLVPAVHRLSKF